LATNILLVREKFTFQNLFKITFVIWHGTVLKKNSVKNLQNFKILAAVREGVALVAV
jgi:hypothetical protein